MTKFVWVWYGYLVFSPVVRVNLAWLMKLPGGRDLWIPFGRSVVGLIRGAQRRPVPAFAVFQVSSGQNNQYTKAACFGGRVLTL